MVTKGVCSKGNECHVIINRSANVMEVTWIIELFQWFVALFKINISPHMACFRCLLLVHMNTTTFLQQFSFCLILISDSCCVWFCCCCLTLCNNVSFVWHFIAIVSVLSDNLCHSLLRGCLMSPPLPGISGLSFDSTLLSPLLFFCLVLLPFLSYRFLPDGPFF